jgi:hypothetical protein
MKKLMIAALLCGLACQAYAQNQALPRLAVVEFTTNNDTARVKESAVTIRNLVESRMVSSGKYQVMSRQEIDALLENQRIQVSSISSKENIAKLQLENINYIVTGSVNAVDSDYLITVKMLDVSSGQFSHSADEFMGGSSRELISGVSALASKFIAGMSNEEGRVVQSGASGGSNGKEYKIGNRGPAGGWVFYDKGIVSDGWRYLEAAGVHGEFSATWNNALNRVDSLVADGYDDWRLPSKEELNMMYRNLHQKGLGDFSNSWYWSSSQGNTDSSWQQHFSSGNQGSYSKNHTGSVRAVRAF